jgi:hypothetical protein
MVHAETTAVKVSFEVKLGAHPAALLAGRETSSARRRNMPIPTT